MWGPLTMAALSYGGRSPFSTL